MVAVKFAGYGNVKALEQWFRMNKARNFGEFEAALKMQALPLFNVIYADVEGNIFFHSGGRVPDRDTSLNWSCPIVGNSSKFKWTHTLPYERMPLSP